MGNAQETLQEVRSGKDKTWEAHNEEEEDG